jgi:hypothetical protein
MEEVLASLSSEVGDRSLPLFVEVPALAEFLGLTVAQVLAMQQDELAVTVGYAEGSKLAEHAARLKREAEDSHG